MTQVELSSGICTQAQISRIEKEGIMPNTAICFEIAHKLGVSLDYFHSLIRTPRNDYILDLKVEAIRLLENHYYEELYHLVQSEKNKRLFQNPEDKQFLLWIESVSLFHHKNQYNDAFQLLKKALVFVIPSNKEVYYKKQELEIIHSEIFFHYKLKNYNQALIDLNELLNYFDNKLLEKNIHLKLKILLTKAKVLTKQSDFHSLKNCCNIGIRLIYQTENFKLLGDFCYYLGYAHINVGDEQKAKSYFDLAVKTFEVTKQKERSSYLLNEIEKYNFL